jgi:hypothetical protein
MRMSFPLKPAILNGLTTRLYVEAGQEDKENGINEPERIAVFMKLPMHNTFNRLDTYVGTNGIARGMVDIPYKSSRYFALTEFLKTSEIEWVEDS